MQNALISIRPQYADQIFAGRKLIEIRRKAVRCSAGTSLWIYVTKPTAAVHGVVVIKRVEIEAPNVVWRRYGENLGIKRQAFLDYTDGAKTISAIHLSEIRTLTVPCTLGKLRSHLEGFHPPQFFRYMNSECPILELLSIHMRTAA